MKGPPRLESNDIEDWQQLKRNVSREEFARRYDHPFLLRRMGRAGGGFDDRDGAPTDRLAFETGVVDPDALVASKAGGLRGARVLPVVKAAGNPFPDRISVGRATNCDVVLRDASVSKLHGHFKVYGPGDADLTENKSRNGISVNGKRVNPGGTVRVAAGDTILFGAVVVQFLDPKLLYELL